MSDNDLPDDLDLLRARYLALADIIGFLLAREALRHPDRQAAFREISKITTSRIERARQARPTDPAEIAFEEQVQGEMDRLIAEARIMLGEKPEGPPA